MYNDGRLSAASVELLDFLIYCTFMSFSSFSSSSYADRYLGGEGPYFVWLFVRNDYVSWIISQSEI